MPTPAAAAAAPGRASTRRSLLLLLLSLNIKIIKFGPSRSAFVSPNTLNWLVKDFELTPISSVEDDIAATLT